jgi:hypothetical protein
LPGTAKIGISAHFFKRLTNGGRRGTVAEPVALESLIARTNAAAWGNKGKIYMKKVALLSVAAAALALTACGGKGDDSLGENVQENYENAAENLDAAAANASGAEQANLENQADALREEGDNKEEAIDEADVNAQEVNAM